MDLDSVTLDDALRLLTLPRTLGELDGEPVTVQNGRYGPYVKQGARAGRWSPRSRCSPSPWTRLRRCWLSPSRAAGPRRAAAAPPLKELGEDAGER